MFGRLQLGLRVTVRTSANGLLTGSRITPTPVIPSIFLQHRLFQRSRSLYAIKPYLLADIGEGITECQVISWSVKPGDRVQQFDAICEVQSDKASVEITSRYEGTVTKLHYDVDDMAAVGSPLLDIEVDDIEGIPDASHSQVEQQEAVSFALEEANQSTAPSGAPLNYKAEGEKLTGMDPGRRPSTITTNSGLVTPGVRRMLKELNLDVADIKGTGRDGRVLKEDIQRHVTTLAPAPTFSSTSNDLEHGDELAQDRRIPLSPIQTQMFQAMTRSLSIPHFLYTHTVDLTPLMSLRQRFVNDPRLSSYLQAGDANVKLTLLPFVLKALSQAVTAFPALNSHLDTDTDPTRPHLIRKAAHNFGVAIDTPNGLLVPVVRDVQKHSIISLATEISRLGALAKEGRLSPSDMKGATLVVSNIGSIGGHTVAPVILAPMTAILAIGKIEGVPAFSTDENGHEKIVKKNQVVLSWSADHRVLDGATVARCAQRVESWLEGVDGLGLILK